MKSNYTKTILQILVLLCFVHLGSAQTTTYTSDHGWSPVTPSSSTGSYDAIVNYSNAPLADGTVLNSLTILNTRSVRINNENVTITNDLTINQTGSLIITGSGSVSVGGNSIISVDGNNSPSQYSIWATPFSDAHLNIYNSFNSVSNNPCDAYAFNASTQQFLYDYSLGFSGTCAGNPVTFSSSTLITDGTADGNMDLGRGYFLPGHATNVITHSSSDQFNNGNVNVAIYGSSVSVAGGNDWNLIGNPYPSVVNAGSLISTNSGLNINAIYIYDGSSGSYQTKSSGSNFPIAPCQGFFVNAATTTDGYLGDFTFQNSQRFYTKGYDFYKTETVSPSIAFISLSGGNYSDQIQIFIDPDCEDGYDHKYDAIKLRNDNGLNISSLMETNPNLPKDHFVFNGIKTFQDKESKVLDLFVETNASGSYEIKIDSLNEMPLGMSIVLEDNVSSTMTNLRDASYTFNSSQPDSLDGRFFLHLTFDADVTSVNNVDVNDILSIHATRNHIFVNAIAEHSQIDQVQVFNIVGTQVATNNNIGYNSTINTESFQSGIYIVKALDTKGNSFTKRVIID